MPKVTVSFIIVFTVLISLGGISYAEESNKVRVECQPVYGHYLLGPRWGWYGAKRVVRTPVEAREIVEKFYIRNKGISVRIIRERAHFFEAELLNARGSRLDLIIIDRRTGRIRTIY